MRALLGGLLMSAQGLAMVLLGGLMLALLYCVVLPLETGAVLIKQVCRRGAAHLRRYVERRN